MCYHNGNRVNYTQQPNKEDPNWLLPEWKRYKRRQNDKKRGRIRIEWYGKESKKKNKKDQYWSIYGTMTCAQKWRKHYTSSYRVFGREVVLPLLVQKECLKFWVEIVPARHTLEKQRFMNHHAQLLNRICPGVCLYNHIHSFIPSFLQT